MDGWIKIHRKLIEKGYYRESEYVHLWVHLLFKANHKPTEVLFNGKIMKLKKGQFITGRHVLSEETGIEESKVERILKLFKSEQQIEQETTTKFRLITVKNWEEYQNNEQQTEQRVNNKRTASEQRVNTDKNSRIKEYIYISDPIFEKALTEFVEMRKKIKKPPTDRAIELILEELHKQPKEIAVKMLQQSIIHSWQGVFPLREDTKKPAAQNKNERVLHDGTKAVKNFGTWVDANNPNVKIDPHYYPEIAKDV